MHFEILPNRTSTFEKWLVLILVIVFALRLWSNIENPDDVARNMTMTHLRIDSLLFGVLISFWYHFRREKLTGFYLKNKTALLLICFAMLLFTPFIEPEDSLFVKTIGFTMLYVSFGILLIHFLIDTNVNRQLNRFFSSKGVDFISKIGFCSYSIYIIHSLIINCFTLLPITNRFIVFPMVFLISVFSGFIMTYKIEKFFLNYRNKYYPSRTI